MVFSSIADKARSLADHPTGLNPLSGTRRPAQAVSKLQLA
ncbi:hypothetical protein PCH70_37740 [Pseudomonas cichorii JBC1]|nr:hypothetical protein PCH70_37740 [Pseudomonas cichorii JBC1]